MPRLEPYLGIATALLIGVFAVSISNLAGVLPRSATHTPAATSTLSVVPSPATPSITAPSLEPKTGALPATPQTPPSGSPAKSAPPVAKKPSPTPATSTPLVATTLPPPTVSSGDIGLDASASNLRGALVNILCYVTVASGLHSISGSGVIIDPKGIILTNAHIAQYFLLTDRGADCIIRSGSPARDMYDAALIYISPLWLQANPTALTQAAPSGTGEYDFALLAITKSATSAALPAFFPSISLAAAPPNVGTPIVIATYGAQFLETSQIQSSLFPTVVFGSVKDIFTFHTNTIDVLALGGSAAAQEGSSGGGISNARGELVGTITTSTVTGDTNTRSLSAITASYIRAEYANEMGSTLDILLAKPTAASVSEFAVKIPMLEAILTAHLP